MDDYLYYTILAALFVGFTMEPLITIFVTLTKGLPGCEGDCEQGDKPCNCRHSTAKQ